MTTSQMRREIAEQPEAVTATLAAVADPAARLAAAIESRRIGLVVLVARGTSDNAATYARYLLEARCGLVASLAAPSLYTAYRAPVDLGQALVIGVSQSGETPEIAAAMEYARSRGALTAALTNGVGSPLAECVDHVLLTAAGEERSIAATKTYTSQLAAIAALARALGAEGLDGLDRVAEAMAETLAGMEQAALAAAAAFGDAAAAVCLARGFAFTVALEAALKLKETTGIWAEGFSTADLRHGPKAAVADLPVITFHGGGPLAADVAELEAELAARGARVLGVGAGRALPAVVLSEALSPFTLVLPAQILAEALARLRGRDPDRPPGLTKVTATE
jgi:glucosamine--fructose-6-phosphate aminotransferase (isomerizing)